MDNVGDLFRPEKQTVSIPSRLAPVSVDSSPNTRGPGLLVIAAVILGAGLVALGLWVSATLKNQTLPTAQGSGQSPSEGILPAQTTSSGLESTYSPPDPSSSDSDLTDEGALPAEFGGDESTVEPDIGAAGVGQPITPAETVTVTKTVAPADPVPVNVAASSILPYREGRYSPMNLIDDDPTTAWCHNGAGGDKASGIELLLALEERAPIEKITVHNGYQKSSGEWEVNKRVQRMTLSDGKRSQIWDLKDTDDPQTMTLDWDNVVELQITINSIYKGSEKPQVCLSEIAIS